MDKLNYRKLPIGGFLKQSLIDYPGHLSSVVFTTGCNFRCFYCHNPELVIPEHIRRMQALNTESITDWIEKYKYLLDAIVITGGEPTIHHSLPHYIDQIKLKNLKVKLDTNGTNSNMLDRLIRDNKIDYVAMDIKAPLTLLKYKTVVGETFCESMLENIKQSIQVLTKSDVNYEFRTTINSIISESDISEIMNSISGKYYLQHTLNTDKTLKPTSAPNIDIQKLKNFSSENVKMHIRD